MNALRANMTMHEIMKRWPRTVPVIIAHRMHCVGCPIAGFHSLEDAIDEHRLPKAEIERAIGLAIKGR